MLADHFLPDQRHRFIWWKVMFVVVEHEQF